MRMPMARRHAPRRAPPVPCAARAAGPPPALHEPDTVIRMSPNPYTDTAESIVEHACAIARLDASELGEAACAGAVADHVHAMRVLATAHVDPVLDRAFFKELKAVSSRADGVFVHFADGVAGVIVDSATGGGQHRFDLLSPAQIERRGDGDADLR